MKYRTESKVEEYYEGLDSLYEENLRDCRIQTLVADNYILLGQLTALRFMEWAGLNPGGVVALTAGKTPEFFIKWLEYYRDNWDRESRDGLVGKLGVLKPDYSSLHFFQMDDFFPICPDHERSFRYFVKRYYTDMLGFDTAKTNFINTWTLDEEERHLLDGAENLGDVFTNGGVDLSLRTRAARNKREELQQRAIRLFDERCVRYEQKIRDLGGIGFFVSGIGPDGHIALNMRGCSPFSRTRLTELNYESQAAAAVNLGGITAVRRKAGVTIGLETITFNPDCVAVIIAAGHSKAKVVAGSLLNEPTQDFPASFLQSLPNARFYITRASAVELPAIKNHLPKINADDVKMKLEAGLQIPQNAVVLHTSPHHDDLELAYFPYLQQLVCSKNVQNHFAYCTSGYTSVTNDYLLSVYRNLLKSIETEEFSIACRIARKWLAEKGFETLEELRCFVESEIRQLEVFESGRIEPDSFHKAKGWLREMEAESVCARLGIGLDRVNHLRLPFYSDDIFPHFPDPDNDVAPVFHLLERIKPTVVSLSLEPEGGGPDTHFKTLIAISAALEQYHAAHPEINLRVWGYRNVWSRWRMSEVNTIIPVSCDNIDVFKNVFDTSYLSQRNAEFPSYEHNGSFSELAEKIWRSQYDDVCSQLGEEFFQNSDNPALKQACGMIYIKDMTYEKFNEYMISVRQLLNDKAFLPCHRSL